MGSSGRVRYKATAARRGEYGSALAVATGDSEAEAREELAAELRFQEKPPPCDARFGDGTRCPNRRVLRLGNTARFCSPCFVYLNERDLVERESNPDEEPVTYPNRAAAVVGAIMDDLSDRGGIKHVLADIDDETRAEMVSTLTGIATRYFEPRHGDGPEAGEPS